MRFWGLPVSGKAGICDDLGSFGASIWEILEYLGCYVCDLGRSWHQDEFPRCSDPPDKPSKDTRTLKLCWLHTFWTTPKQLEHRRMTVTKRFDCESQSPRRHVPQGDWRMLC